MSSKKLKKDLQQKVAETLAITFEEFKKDISPKKFRRNIRKASKALLAGLATTPTKESSVKKSIAKKTSGQKKKVQEPVTVE